MSDPGDPEHPDRGTSSSLPGGFRAAVTSELQGKGYAIVEWEADGVNVVAPDRDGEQYIGLSNLFRRARSAGKAAWTTMIREFLGQITTAHPATAIPDDLSAVAHRLRPRLGMPFPRQGQAYPWGIPLAATGLEVNLVVDFPHTMAYVTEEMLARSGQAGEDLLDCALANLRAETPPDFFEPASDEIDILVGHSGDGYDAARALLVEDLLPNSPAGFWVVLPTRDEIAVWPVSFEALSRIQIIKLFAELNFREQAYPITDEVYWLWNGTLYPFGITVDGQNVTVSPPDEFMIALQELDGGPL